MSITTRGTISVLIGLALLFATIIGQAQGNKPKQGKPKQAPASFQPVLQENLADAVLDEALDQMWHQTDRHFHEGEFNHCVNLNIIITKGDPKFYQAFENSSYLLWSMDRGKEALALLQEGLKSNDDRYDLFAEVGGHYATRLKDYSHAIPYYEKAVKFKVPYVIWNALARCYEQTNQWEKAVWAWGKATIDSANGVATVRLKRARAELEKRKKQ